MDRFPHSFGRSRFVGAQRGSCDGPRHGARDHGLGDSLDVRWGNPGEGNDETRETKGGCWLLGVVVWMDDFLWIDKYIHIFFLFLTKNTT